MDFYCSSMFRSEVLAQSHILNLCESVVQIDKVARDKGLIPKGPNPQGGKGSYVDPVTGKQRVLCHSNCANPHAHVNNPQGQRLDINGKVVPRDSSAAHVPIKVQ